MIATALYAGRVAGGKTVPSMSGARMNSRCACFTSDLGYMFPTLLSAIQARQHLDQSSDVVILLFHGGDPVDDVFAAVCARYGIKLLTASLDVLQGHTTMYARLFLDGLLPPEYSRILYIDGDVQIVGPLDGLIESDLPAESVGAIADPMAILLKAGAPESPRFAAYFDGIGVNSVPNAPYFNSGVLLINRASWVGISRTALKLLSEQPELCLFQDQSALNFAAHKVMVPMSFKWNFPIFLRNGGLERAIRPTIYHFMSKPKPWDGNFPPWNKGFSEPYLRLKRQFPGLDKYVRRMPLKVQAKYAIQQRLKMVEETLAWRFSKRRDILLAFDQASRI